MNATLFSDAATELDSVPTEMPSDVAMYIVPDERPQCEQCENRFEPRKGSGGRPQRFCGTECRLAWHAAHPKAQRSPTCSDETPLPAAAVSPSPKIAPEVSPDTGDAFDWCDKDNVVIDTQRATAIYWNAAGQVVIRQEAGWSDDDDPYLFFEPANLPRVIERLQTEHDSWKRDRRG